MHGVAGVGHDLVTKPSQDLAEVNITLWHNLTGGAPKVGPGVSLVNEVVNLAAGFL